MKEDDDWRYWEDDIRVQYEPEEDPEPPDLTWPEAFGFAVCILAIIVIAAGIIVSVWNNTVGS